ncbi:MAG: DUF368 domain-containing protein [Defluviitaleaceae bacterium]|nr:DUF368 domain-containing protein [Defluviitaleaceae bacterium]
MIINLIKGALIGLGLVLPGLSGSIFAVVVGLYDDIIIAVNTLRRDLKKNIKFLLPILIGIAIGILASASATVYVIENFPFQSYAFFIGLVLGSLPKIYGKIAKGRKNYKLYPIAVFGFFVILIMAFFSPDSSETAVAMHAIEGIGDAATILLAGVISCFFMTIPGMSGSVMLMLLGHFGTVYGAVSNFVDVGIMMVRGQPGVISEGLASLGIIVMFSVGALAGIVAAARIIGFLIERYEIAVYFGVTGLIVGAVVVLFNLGISETFINNFAEGGILSGIIGVLWLVLFTVLGFVATHIISGKEPENSKKAV